MATEPNKIIYSMMRVSKFYDKKPVIKDISLSYFYGAKIGVLGLNGSGKSSLLRIMAGVDKDFNGQAVLSPGYTVGFLEQEPQLDEGKTVRQIVEEGVQETVDLLAEFNGITDKFSDPDADFEETVRPAGRAAGKAGPPGCLGSGQPPGDGHGCPALPAGRRAGQRCCPAARSAAWRSAGCC